MPDEKRRKGPSRLLQILPHDIALASEAYGAGKSISGDAISVDSRTFPLCIIPNVFQSAFAASLKPALELEHFVPKSNDLYRFHQTRSDLASSKNEVIRELVQEIYSQELISIVSRVTGISLSSTIDISGQRYDRGDYLLCHDDQLRGRRVAFVFYLVDCSWSEQDGGSLDFFCSQRSEKDSFAPVPCDCVNSSFSPRWNTLVFFTVTDSSFHQVSENTSPDHKTRLSIAGWYHEAVASVPKVESLVLESFLTAEYLKAEFQAEIADKFLEDSSAVCFDWVLPRVYARVHRSLEMAYQQKKFVVCGPPNRRRFFVLPREEYSAELAGFVSFLTGKPLITHIKESLLGSAVNDCNQIVDCSIRLFTAGSYSLIDEQAVEKAGLDFQLFLLDTSSCDLRCGDGSLHYVSENDSLVEVIPRANSLSIVYKTPESEAKVFSFFKYLSRLSTGHFFVIAWSLEEAES